MGTTNLSKVQQKLKQLKSTSNRSANQFKPKPGSHVVRIVPNQESPDWPFVELFMYYNIGGERMMVSPSSYGEYDPIKAFTDELYKTGEKEDYFKAKSLEPKLRTYLPIIERGKEQEGVKWWGFGKTIMKDLLNIFGDEDYGDIADPVSGIDIKLTVEAANPDAGKKYPTTTITPKRKSTPISENSDIMEQALSDQVSITEVFPGTDEITLMNALEVIKTQSQNEGESDSTESSNYNTSKSNNDVEYDEDTKEKLNSFDALVKNKS